MSQNNDADTLERASGEKGFAIIINGRPRVVEKPRLTFAEISALAFPTTPPSSTIVYTVTYRNARNPSRPEGTLVDGEFVIVRDGTIFDVTETDKS